MIKYPDIFAIRSSLPKLSGVYRLYNWKTKRNYIGFTNGKYGIYGRVSRHFERLISNTHENSELQADWNLNNTCWTACVLELTTNKEKEIYWTQQYDAHVTGYNLKLQNAHTDTSKQRIRENHAGGTPVGYKCTDETKRKIGLANKGCKRHPEWDNGVKKMIKENE